MSKIKEYFDKQVKLMCKFYPDEDPKKIKSIVRDIIKERDSQKEDSSITIEFNDDETPTMKNVPIKNLEDMLEEEKPIITKYGTAFYRHDEKESILGQMIEYLASLRKEAKGHMLEHLNDEDQTLYNMYDMIQKTIKILMNSFYGVLTAKGSIFRNLDCGESITHTGELIIMTAISIFERFITNNIRFYSISNIITYCDNIINEDYESDKYFTIGFKKNIDIENLVNYFIDHIVDENIRQKKINKEKFINSENNVLIEYLETLSQDELNKIYYKNNLVEFFENAFIVNEETENEIIFYEGFEEILKGVFLDPNNPSEEQDEILDTLWSIINDYVFYDYQNYYKYEECKNGTRNTVLTVDTDSNFLYLGTMYLFFKKKFPEFIDDSKEKKVTSINTITYFLTNVINQTYLKLTEESGIPEDKRSLINMKNEFMLARILLTKNKKNYASSVLMKEGKLMNSAKIDIKGMSIKKTDTNKYVREYFTEILKNDIINSDEIDYSTIIRKYFDFSDYIKNSILKGETKFSIPGKANEIKTYKLPYNMQAVRGIILWNILYPNEEIKFPSNVNMFKLDINNDIEWIEETIRVYCEENNFEIDDNDLNDFISKMKSALNEEKLFKDGKINIVSFPKTLSEFPIYLRPFIKVERMIYDQLNAGTILLDCLDIQTPKINDNLIPTNIIKI